MTLPLNLSQDDHGIDRLHLKAGIAVDNTHIAIFAMGKPKEFTGSLTGLQLMIKVTFEAGEYKLELVHERRVFPTVFCRQLDHV